MRRLTETVSPVWAGILGLATVACGSGDAKVVSCGYSDFVALVSTGPNASLKLQGVLQLVQGDDAKLYGSLYHDYAFTESIPVIGSISGSMLSLSLLSQRGTLAASGTLSGAFSTCPQPLGGTFTGPQAGDTGDWQSYLRISDSCTGGSAGGEASYTCSGAGTTCSCTYPAGGNASCKCTPPGGI